MKKEFELPEADYKLYILLCRKNTYYVRLATLSKTKAKFKSPSLGHKTGVDGPRGLIKHI